mgnify:CR=1 FL=1|tara:strand:- start:2686 stop:2913 length:228 start_codon:yes stop_codon:yes gene_type:complete
MTNYKIKNLRTNKSYFLNEEETANFFVKNKAQNYDIINLSEQKRIKTNNILDALQFFCLFALTILTTIYIIENFY